MNDRSGGSRSVDARSRPRLTHDAGLLSSSAVMAAGTVVSRVTGFGRAAIIAAALGLSTTAADVYNLPNVIPNMIYILVGGGILNSVLVPAMVRAIKNDADDGEAYSQRLFSLMVTVLGLATLIAVIAAPWIMKAIVNPTYLEPNRAEFFDNMVTFARFCLPQIFFYGLYVLIGQMLNARGRFGPMMWAPIINNLIAMVVFIAYIAMFGVKPSTETFSNTEVLLLGAGSTLGVAAQALILIPVLKQTGFSLRFRTDLRRQGLGETVRLGLWTFGFVAVNQLAYLIVVKVSSGASVIGDQAGGGYTVYANALLMLMVPHSVITVSLATALLPRLADLASDDDHAGVRERLITALRTCLAVIIPVSALLVALAYPLTGLIFDYGSARGQTGTLALTLIMMMPGLVAFTAHYLVLRGFYALQDTRTPFFTQIWVSATMVIGAIIVAAWSPDRQYVTAMLGAGYSLAYVIGTSVGFVRLQRQLGSLRTGELIRHVIRVAVPATLAAGLGWLVLKGWELIGLFNSFPAVIDRVVELGLGGSVALLAFIGLAYAFDIQEVRQAVTLSVDRAARRPAPEPEPTPDPGEHLDDTAEHEIPAETGTLSLFRRALDPEMTSEFVLDDTMHGIPSIWDSTTTAADYKAQHLDIDTQPDLPPVSPPAEDPVAGTARYRTQAADSPSEQSGRMIVGRYRLDVALNEPPGQSWQATDEVLRRPVFIYTLPVDDPRAETFAAAARAAATVSDPRFLRVLDVGVDGCVYVVREWTPGHSLANLLAAGPLQADQAAAVARELGDALSVAHAQGLSHRRIDPSGVFVTTEGTIKIAGLETEAALHGARPLGDSPGRPATEAGLVDSAGICSVLYAGLTGRWPWEPFNGLPEAPRVDGRIPSPRQVRPGIPRDLDVIVDRGIGHASRHHATPLMTPSAVLSELLSTTSGQAQVGGYDGPVPPAFATPDPQSYDHSVPPPHLATRQEPPPLPPTYSKQRQRRSNSMRVAGVIGAALLLVGATLIGLQLLLRAFDSPTADERDLPASPPAEESTPDESDAAEEPQLLEIVSSSDLDPPPAGNGEEHPEEVTNAFDGDPSTTWETQTYFDPMEDQKPGVGIYLDFGEDVDIRQVDLALVGSGSALELRIAPAGSDEPPSAADDWEPVAELNDVGSDVSHEFDQPVSSRYLLVWFTRLPPTGEDFRGGIAELEVLG